MLNLLFIFFIWVSILLPQTVFAATWQNLWLNKNQQGASLLKQNKNNEAAQAFTNNNWKGVAYYRAGKFQQAYDEFKLDNSAQGLYNQGNALAHLGKYQEALAAYDKSLQLQKNSPDTTYNKQLVEKLLEQQKQQNQSDKNQQNSKNKTDKNQQQNSGQQQNKQNQSGNNQSQQNSSTNQPNTNDASKNQPQTGSNTQNTQSGQKTPDQPDKSQKTSPMQSNGRDPQKNTVQQQAAAPNKPDQQTPADKASQQQASNNFNSQPMNPTSNNSSPNPMRQQTPVDIEVKSALSQIPDDPGGLLRNKFLRDYQNQTQENK